MYSGPLDSDQLVKSPLACHGPHLAGSSTTIEDTRFFPELLFEASSDLIGHKSIEYMNGAEGRKRRHLMDEGFNHTAVAYYYDHFVKVQ